MDRAICLERYLAGWETLDAALVLSTLDEGFQYIDPSMPTPITKAMMSDYMAQWAARTAALGGTGECALRDTVTADRGDGLLSWTWWSFTGTAVEGAASIVGMEDALEENR